MDTPKAWRATASAFAVSRVDNRGACRVAKSFAAAKLFAAA
jgi:hypothetical protein